MNLPSANQFVTIGRYVATYASGFVTCAVAAHVADPDQGKSALDAIQQITSGLVSIWTGATTLVAFAAGIWGTISAGLKSQIAAVQAAPQAQVTVTDPKLAEGIPGVKVVP